MEPLFLPCPGSGFFASPEARRRLEEEVLPSYLPACRWFGGKARGPKGFRVTETVALTGGTLVLVEVTYESGPPETYSLPLRVGPAGEAIATFSDGLVLAEALDDETFRRALLEAMENERSNGPLRGERGHGMPAGAASFPSRVLKVEQSNSSLVFGGEVFVKLFRKLEDGVNPDVEITRFLKEELRFSHVPPFAGTLQLAREGREPQVLALALGMIENKGDAWAQTLGEVRHFYRRIVASPAGGPGRPALFGEEAPAAALIGQAGAFVARVRQLGTRTGETHLALASRPEDPVFAPEPFTLADQQELSAAVRAAAERVFALLERAAPTGPGQELLAKKEAVFALASRIGEREVTTAKTRTHGDYHLGQVLDAGDDYVLIDFEGEPQRSLAERKQKRSPLRDVAGMLRSFHYAAHSGLGDFTEQRPRLEPWAEGWSALMGRTFLQAWLETCAGAVFLPRQPEETELLLKGFLLEKAIYEVQYELNNRPAWVEIPLRGILQLLHA